MSRTDKDQPYWVAIPWTPEHAPACRSARTPCTLPDRPQQHHPDRSLDRRTACYWSPTWPRNQPRYTAPPRWFIRHQWTAPDRQAVRAACDLARAQHRGGNVPEAEPPTFQHRNCAKWLWW